MSANERRSGPNGPNHLIDVSHRPEHDAPKPAPSQSPHEPLDDAPLAISGRIGVIVAPAEYLRMHDNETPADIDDADTGTLVDDEDAADAAFRSSTPTVTSRDEMPAEDLESLVSQLEAQRGSERDAVESSSADQDAYAPDSEPDPFEEFAQRSTARRPPATTTRRGSAGITATPARRPRSVRHRSKPSAAVGQQTKPQRRRRSAWRWSAGVAVLIAGIALAAIAAAGSSSSHRATAARASTQPFGNFTSLDDAFHRSATALGNEAKQVVHAQQARARAEARARAAARKRAEQAKQRRQAARARGRHRAAAQYHASAPAPPVTATAAPTTTYTPPVTSTPVTPAPSTTYTPPAGATTGSSPPATSASSSSSGGGSSTGSGGSSAPAGPTGIPTGATGCSPKCS